MENNSYTATIGVSGSPEDIVRHICDVTKWWNRDAEGASTNLNDEFIISHDGIHYSKQKLVELVPGRRVVWLVTDSEMGWLTIDKHEWTDTKMIFEITPNGDKTSIHFTHEGLVPAKECYNLCIQGWDLLIKSRLSRFIDSDIPFYDVPEDEQEARAKELREKAKNLNRLHF